MKLSRLISGSNRALQRLSSGQFDTVWYSVSSRLRGLDFSPASAESLGLNPKEAVHYSNSGGPILEAVFRQIRIPQGSRIVDFGSGKGGSALTLAKFPFREVLGVELSPELVEVALRNRAKVGALNVEFAIQDATKLTTDLDRFSHAYLFNPFSPAIFQQVYANVLESLARRPRPLTVVCEHPEQPSIESCWPESATFRRVRKLEFKLNHPFYIFEARGV